MAKRKTRTKETRKAVKRSRTVVAKRAVGAAKGGPKKVVAVRKPAPEPEYPNQSERGKCELRITKDGRLYCEQLDGCRGQCVLYSIPQGQPKAPWRPEREQPAKPDPKRYYFCRCLEL
jgi:hypothetical protein